MELNLDLLRQTFLEESFESIEIMESGLIRLGEGETDNELIHTIFRAAHSMKGGAGSVGFSAITEFTHSVETLLDQMRSGTRSADSHLIDMLLKAVDCLRGMLSQARDAGTIDPSPYAAAKKALEAMLDKPGESSSKAATAASGAKKWAIDFAPNPGMLRSCNDPLRIFADLAELGDLEARPDLTRLPDFQELDPEECRIAWKLELDAETTEKKIAEAFAWVDGDCRLEIVPVIEAAAKAVEIAQPTAEAGGAHPEEKKSSGTQQASSIRVEIDKIDSLINMVGELVITQSMLGQLGEDFDMSRLDRLKDGLVQLQRHTRELQENVMRIRMLPIGFAFNRFPRLVRDLSQKLDKKVELRVSGEQTELDKTVLEKISDPLVHLVRNALDHGLESPDVRREAGKSETGVVSLNAFHHSGNIVIEIKDDGRGIDRVKVLAKARSAGIVGPDEILPDDRVLDLIFQPGFSTAEVISDVSGRGVGMDVVRRNILELGGSITTTTELGKGTTFSIRLPLTLAILDGQTVRVGEQRYIFPLVQIVEAIQVKSENIRTVSGRAEMFHLRNEFLPIIRLYRLFDIEPDSTDITNGLIVVVESDGKRHGMMVDELLGQQQIVIKSLETNLRRIDGLSGATILGDGQVALILDIPGLVRISKERGTELISAAMESNHSAS